MDNALFRTVLSSTYNMAAQRKAEEAQIREAEQRRRDMLNEQTSRALLGAMREMGAQQDRDIARRGQMAQQFGMASGNELSGEGIPADVQVASRVGAATNELQENRRAEDIAVRRALEEMQQAGQMERTKQQIDAGLLKAEFTEAGRMTRQDRQLAMERAKLAEARRRNLANEQIQQQRADAYEAGASKSSVVVNPPEAGGGSQLPAKVIRDIKGREVENRDVMASLIQLRNQIRKNPRALDFPRGMIANVDAFMDQMGFGVREKELLKDRFGPQANLALTRLQVVKPLLGVMTGRDYEIASQILTAVDWAGASPEKIQAQIDALLGNFARRGLQLEKMAGGQLDPMRDFLDRMQYKLPEEEFELYGSPPPNTPSLKQLLEGNEDLE